MARCATRPRAGRRKGLHPVARLTGARRHQRAHWVPGPEPRRVRHHPRRTRPGTIPGIRRCPDHHFRGVGGHRSSGSGDGAMLASEPAWRGDVSWGGELPCACAAALRNASRPMEPQPTPNLQSRNLDPAYSGATRGRARRRDVQAGRCRQRLDGAAPDEQHRARRPRRGACACVRRLGARAEAAGTASGALLGRPMSIDVVNVPAAIPKSSSNRAFRS